MIKLTFNSTMSAIEFNEDNIEKIEKQFNVSIKKYVSYVITDDDDRQQWEKVDVGDFVCQTEGENHVSVLHREDFQAVARQAIDQEES